MVAHPQKRAIGAARVLFLLAFNDIGRRAVCTLLAAPQWYNKRKSNANSKTAVRDDILMTLFDEIY